MTGLRIAAKSLALCLVLAASLGGILWSVLIPPFLPPDEIQHFLYGQEIAQDPALWLPPRTSMTREIVSLLRFNGVERRSWMEKLPARTPAEIQSQRKELERLAKSRQWVESLEFLPHAQFNRYHPFLYYSVGAAIQSAFQKSDVGSRLTFNRWWTVLLTLVVIAVSYRLGRTVWPEDKQAFYPTLLAVSVAFHPNLVCTGASVSNIMLEALFFNAGLLLFLQILKGNPSTSKFVALGIVTGAGCLSRVSFICFPVLVFGSLVCLAPRKLVDRRWLATLLLAILIPLGWYLPLIQDNQAAQVVTSYKGNAYQAEGDRGNFTNPLVYFSRFDWSRWSHTLDDYWSGDLGLGLAPKDNPQTPAGIRALLSLFFGLGAAASLVAAAKAVLSSRKLDQDSRVRFILLLAWMVYMVFFQALDYYFSRNDNGFFWFRSAYFVPLVPVQMLLSLDGFRKHASKLCGIAAASLTLLTPALLFFQLIPKLYPQGTLSDVLMRTQAWSPLGVGWLLCCSVLYVLACGSIFAGILFLMGRVDQNCEGEGEDGP